MIADFDPARLAALEDSVQHDVSTGLYWGASIKVARHGVVALDLAVGTADQKGTAPIANDSVFSVFSITKTFTNALTLRAVELGRIALTTKVADVIPEFAGAPRDRATIFHLLTHTAGMTAVWEPRPGQYLDELSTAVSEVCAYVQGVSEPGERCDYAPMANHVLLGEILRRTDPAGRPIGQIYDEDLFQPLGMADTALGIRPHMRERHVIPDMRGVVPIKHLSRTTPGDHGLYEAPANECTWVGAGTTSGDLMKFANMLRGEGTLEKVCILSPRTVRMARKVWTGDLPNELYKTVALRAGYAVPPAYLGLGFNVRGSQIVDTQLGTLTSPETFGNYGAGSALYWVDPEMDVTFVCLTAGLLPQAANIARFQRLSDIAITAAN
ncbi:serine hydrolase domain-containing protein [Microbacterium sp.]|uniref:serine hydrolase domain-containing protein n=1 Tax=Microbacterium sp. TaxID=51671 RepID=UPI003A93C702